MTNRTDLGFEDVSPLDYRIFYKTNIFARIMKKL